MPIIRSSRVLYKWSLPVVFGAWFSSCRCGVELRVVCPVCGLWVWVIAGYNTNFLFSCKCTRFCIVTFSKSKSSNSISLDYVTLEMKTLRSFRNVCKYSPQYTVWHSDDFVRLMYSAASLIFLDLLGDLCMSRRKGSSFAYRWSRFCEVFFSCVWPPPRWCLHTVPLRRLKRHVNISHIIVLEEDLWPTNAAQPCTAADDWTGLLTCLIVAWRTLHTTAVCFIRLSH